MNIQTMPVYNYEQQVYIADGPCSIAHFGDEEFFPCPKCQAPALMLYYTSYYERYRCIDASFCGHTFSVR